MSLPQKSAVKMKVLISGAGIAGPCLAYWLSQTRHDISITVIERSSTPRVTGQAIDIRSGAVGIVKKMGLEKELRAFNTTEEGTAFLSPSGKTLAHFGIDKANSMTAEYEILRADLSQLFLDITKDLPNVEYKYGDYVDALEQTEDEVHVTFASGSKETYDLLVVADGSSSKTRTLILDRSIFENSYKFLGQYMAFFSIPSRPTDSKLWQWYSVPKGRSVMIRPHRNPKTMGAYLCATMPTRNTRDPALEDALNKGGVEAQKAWNRKFYAGCGWETERILQGMEESDDFYMSRIAQVRLPKWTNGRALVLGDAAFATMGVGTSFAIESAYVLAGELSKVQSRSDIPVAVRKYEEVFRPVVEKVGEMPSVFPQLICPQTSLGLGLRNWVIWFVWRTKLYKLFPMAPGEESAGLPTYECFEK